MTFLLVWLAAAVWSWCMWCWAVADSPPEGAEERKGAAVALALGVVLPAVGSVALFFLLRWAHGRTPGLRLWFR